MKFKKISEESPPSSSKRGDNSQWQQLKIRNSTEIRVGNIRDILH